LEEVAAVTELTGALKFYTVASTLVTAVQEALTTEVDRAGVVPGQIAWDGGDCGLLAASVGPVYLSDVFPHELQDVIGYCSASWEVSELTFQLVRPAPGPESNQSLYPTRDALDTAAQLLATDGWLMLTTLSQQLCQMRLADTIVDFLLGQVTPIGPEGGLMAQQVTVYIGLPRG
jgi:hypothetical protein